MAIAFDANIGVNDFLTSTTHTLVTTAAAAANTRIVVLISYFGTGSVTTACSIGGTAAALDKHATNGSDFFDIWSAHLAAGLASGSNITVTGGQGGGFLIGAASFTGIQSTAGYLDTVGAANGSGASWSSGAATASVASSLYVGGSGSENATAHTSVAVSGTELHDRYRVADGQGFATGYKILSSIASDAITGTFSNAGSTANTGGLAVYKDAAAGAAAPPYLYMAPMRR